MSKFTTELRYIVDNEKLFPPSDTDLSLTNILKNYPLQNADLVNPLNSKKRRDELNERIINHYYFREIGFETVPRFLFQLQKKINEIMPYYNQMYESVDLDINPIDNVNMTETFEHTITGTGTASKTGSTDNTGTIGNVSNTDNTGTVSNVNGVDSSSSGDSLNVESDTPQSGVTENDIKANTYASKTNYNKGTSTSSTDTTNTETLDTNISSTNTETLDTNISTTESVNSTDSKTESFTRKEFGSSKGYTFAQNIEQWRNIMINVDMLIVDELNDLFMNIW